MATLYSLLKGTIVKLYCQKQPQGPFFEKVIQRIQLKIYRENVQQGAFTPIKFNTQPA